MSDVNKKVVSEILQRTSFVAHYIEEGEYDEASAVAWAENAVNDIHTLVKLLAPAPAPVPATTDDDLTPEELRMSPEEFGRHLADKYADQYRAVIAQYTPAAPAPAPRYDDEAAAEFAELCDFFQLCLDRFEEKFGTTQHDKLKHDLEVASAGLSSFVNAKRKRIRFVAPNGDAPATTTGSEVKE